MTIWIVNHYALPPNRPGGTRHFALAKELRRRGYQVVIVASSFDHQRRLETRLKPGEPFQLAEEEGVPFLWLRTLPYRGNDISRVLNMLSFALSVLTQARHAIVGKPDLIIGSSPHPFAALAAQLLSRRYKIPFVLEVRDLWPQSLVELGSFSSRHPLIMFLEQLERYLYRRAHAIVTLLPLAHEHMVKKGAPGERIYWIPNGVDMEQVPLPQPPAHKRRLVALYAGAHGIANNLDLILDAAYLLKVKGWDSAIEFKLIGDGPEKSRLIERARSLGLANVRFEDPIPKNHVFKVLSDGDILLLALKDSPLFRFGVSPNKLFDYMAVARPIVFAGNSPGNPVEQAQAGYVVSPSRPEELAQAIYHLTQLSLEERWAMGLRGRSFLEKHHSVKRLVDRLEEVFESVLKVSYVEGRK